MSTDITDRLQLVADSPLGQHLGWKADSLKPDQVVLRLPFAQHNVTEGTVVHGGVIASLADAAATAACWATELVTSQSRGTTIALNINYLNAARECELIATADVVQRGRSVCVAQVFIEDSHGLPIARATATYKLSH